MSNIFDLETPENFNFSQTVNSHGWSQLLPFESDHENLILSYVFTDENANNPVSATIGEADGKLIIETGSADFHEKILRDVRRILRFDEDLSKFYKILKSEKRLAWIAKKSAGRLLRSPTVFEDLVKTICTTNCSWSLTKAMVKNLVEKLGAETKDGKHAFPTAEAMASVPAEFYRTEIRAGYRSAYFAELAEKAASGKLNPENWLDCDLPTTELKKEMKSIKGVGEYAAENLLKLVGRYDGLALDSFLRSEFYKKHNHKNACDDQQICDFYEKFGDWCGLAIWCDLTER